MGNTKQHSTTTPDNHPKLPSPRMKTQCLALLFLGLLACALAQDNTVTVTKATETVPTTQIVGTTAATVCPRSTRTHAHALAHTFHRREPSLSLCSRCRPLRRPRSARSGCCERSHTTLTPPPAAIFDDPQRTI